MVSNSSPWNGNARRDWKKLAFAGALVGLALARMTRKRKESLAGKVAVITGGSRGLGLALARELATFSMKLALVARDDAELQRAAAELREKGSEVSTWAVDLTQGDGCETVLGRIAAHHGSLDVLINNAGEILVGPFETCSHHDFDRSLAIHLWAPLRLTQAAIPLMRSQGGGRIVNISSIGGKIPVPHLSAYCAGKFALTGLSGTLRGELRKDGIVVTTVCPGLMRTGSHWHAIFKGEQKKEFAWFGHAASLPGLSMSAKRAARQIVEALRRGDAEVVISWPARAAVLASALAPAWMAGVETIGSRLLPAKPEHGGEIPKDGCESRSWWMPSLFTRLGDRAALRNNEFGDNGSPL